MVAENCNFKTHENKRSVEWMVSKQILNAHSTLIQLRFNMFQKGWKGVPNSFHIAVHLKSNRRDLANIIEAASKALYLQYM